jgi:hypothetical protein
MAKAKAFYANDLTGAGPSPAIWADCPVLDILEDPSRGYGFFDDFVQMVEATGGWAAGGTNNTCTNVATQVGGVAQVGTGSSDNDEGWLTSGNNEAGMAKIYTTTPRKLWFEARVQFSRLTDSGLFVGCAEEALAAAGTLADDTGVLASKDFVGFHAATATPTVLHFVYRKAGSAAVNIKATALTAVISTWYKLGFRFDGNYLRGYVDGVELASPLLVSTATNFPDGEELAALLGVKTGTTAAVNVLVDWVRYYALRTPE